MRARGTVFHQAFQGGLNHALALGIQRRGGFVQQQGLPGEDFGGGVTASSVERGFDTRPLEQGGADFGEQGP